MGSLDTRSATREPSLTNESLFARREAAVPRGVGNATRVIAARAAGAEVWDVEGRRYLDFASGIAVTNTGHCHPRVMAAVRDQLDRFTHTAFQVMAYEPYIALAERLKALAQAGSPLLHGSSSRTFALHC